MYGEKIHLQNEPSKEPARDSEKIRDGEAEDETGKLTVSKSVGRELIKFYKLIKEDLSESNVLHTLLSVLIC